MNQKENPVEKPKNYVKIVQTKIMQHSFFSSYKKRVEFIKKIDHVSIQELQQLSKQILKTQPNDRNKEELLVLKKANEKIQFFQKLQQDNPDEETLNLCLKNMALETFEQHQIVFEKGMPANKFYIIIEGQIGVWVTNSTPNDNNEPQKKDKKRTQRDRSQTISITTQLGQIQKKNNISNRKGNRQLNILQSLQRNSAGQAMKLFLLQQTLSGQINQNKYRRMLKVNELHPGDSFGELALINDAPRLATIVCEQDCEFAVLTKTNYKNILLEAQKKKVQKDVKELSENPGFQMLSRKILNILLYAFQPILFGFREFVYKEGDTSTCKQIGNKQRDDTLYLIKEGEFIMFRTIDINIPDRGPLQYDYQVATSHSKLIEKQTFGHAKSQIAVLTKGQIFGEEEAFKEQPRKYSVQCNSEQGVLLTISYKVLLERLQSTNETQLIDFWKEIGIEKNQWRQILVSQICKVQDAYRDFISDVHSKHNSCRTNKSYTEQSEKFIKGAPLPNLKVVDQHTEIPFFSQINSNYKIKESARQVRFEIQNKDQDKLINEKKCLNQTECLLPRFSCQTANTTQQTIMSENLAAKSRIETKSMFTSLDFHRLKKTKIFERATTRYQSTIEKMQHFPANRRIIIKSPEKERKDQKISQPLAALKYENMITAKMNLLGKICGDVDLHNQNLAYLKFRLKDPVQGNRKFIINNSVVVRLGDDITEDTQIPSQQITQRTLQIQQKLQDQEDFEVLKAKSVEQKIYQQKVLNEGVITLKRVLQKTKKLKLKKRAERIAQSFVEYIQTSRSIDRNN